MYSEKEKLSYVKKMIDFSAEILIKYSYAGLINAPHCFEILRKVLITATVQSFRIIYWINIFNSIISEL